MAAPKKNKKRSNRSKKKGRFPVLRGLILLSGILLAGLSLLVIIYGSQRKPQLPSLPSLHSPVIKTPAAGQKNAPNRTQAVIEKTAHPQKQTAHNPTYEPPRKDFDATVHTVDAALLQALEAAGSSAEALRFRAVETRIHQGQEFHYQNITIFIGQDFFPFLADLRQRFQQAAPGVRIRSINNNPRDLEVSINGQATHHLFFPLEPIVNIPENCSAAKMVIIIDDLGGSIRTAKRLASLPFPITFSVLPYTPHAREVAHIARAHQRELLLHLPCEPKGYPKRADSGPGTLRASMTRAKLEQTLVEDLAQLPEVDGVNNHMGSLLTENRRAMRVVLAHLKGRGKFFVDSMTTPKSAVPRVAKELGMHYYRRDIFLDNVAQERAIFLQLRKAESYAKRHGTVIVIGHPYSATVRALETWAHNRDQNIRICHLQLL